MALPPVAMVSGMVAGMAQAALRSAVAQHRSTLAGAGPGPSGAGPSGAGPSGAGPSASAAPARPSGPAAPAWLDGVPEELKIKWAKTVAEDEAAQSKVRAPSAFSNAYTEGSSKH